MLYEYGHISPFRFSQCLVLRLPYVYFPLVIVMYILLDTSRCPFDLAEAESELIAGYVTEYSSTVFSLVFLCEYGNIIACALLLQLVAFSFA